MSKGRHGGSRQRHRPAPATSARPQILTHEQAQERISSLVPDQTSPSRLSRLGRKIARLFRFPKRRGPAPFTPERRSRAMSNVQYAAKVAARRRRRSARAAAQHVRRKNGKW